MYGMTELSTQFYDSGNETLPSVKSGPHWIRSRLVEPITGRDVPAGERGILVHCDLANYNAVTTILTEDVGLWAGADESSGFLLLGRAEGAAAKGCSLIVAHHPVIFSPLKKLTPRDVSFQLVQKGISAICMHTNLDAAEGGVNEVLAGIFDMKNMETFAEGCGRVGAIEEIAVPELARKAQQELAARCNQPKNGPAVQVKFVDAGKPVKRLAVISGAGGSLFADAIAMGADCLLTGEANHHHAIDAKRLGLSLIAAGHYATEFPVTAAVAAKLRAALPELDVLVSTENRDPYTYL